MNISVSSAQGKVPVTVIKLDGQLDGQTYQDLIAKAKEAYQSGARSFLLDFSDLTYISSAGLVALHTVALLARGDALPRYRGRLVCDPLGWARNHQRHPETGKTVEPAR